MINKICQECDKNFRSLACHKRKYCSKKCSNLNLKGNLKKGHKWVGKLRAGGIRLTSTGYITIYSPNHPMKNVNNVVAEHRLVMEKKIGRYLKRKEVVHHKNGIKTDNRISNLQLFNSHSEHVKEERRIKKINS